MDNIEMNLNDQDESLSLQNRENTTNLPVQPTVNNIELEKIALFTQVPGESEQLLKKKREPGMDLEKSHNELLQMRGPITEDLADKTANEKCQICSKSEWKDSSNRKVCKICRKSFHYECVFSQGEFILSSDFTCLTCQKNNLIREICPQKIGNQTLEEKQKDLLNLHKLIMNNDKNTNLFNYLPTNFTNSKPVSEKVHQGPHPQLMNMGQQSEFLFNQTNGLTNPLIQNLMRLNVGHNPLFNPNVSLGAQSYLMTQMLLKGLSGTNQQNPNFLNFNQNMGYANPPTHQSNVTNVNLINNLINCVNYQNINPKDQQNIFNQGVFPNFLNNHNSNISQLKKILSNLPGKNKKVENDENNLKTTLHEKSPFPIEDTELRKNPDAYGIDIECYERPEFAKLITPEKYQSKILLIWDFILTFGLDFWKDYPQYILTKFDVDKFYENLNDEKSSFFSDLSSFLLLPFINYCTSVETEEFQQHKELLLIKTLKENINTDFNIILERVWPELIRVLINSKKFSLLVDKNLRNVSDKILENSSLNLEDKLSLTLFLINSSFDLPVIKQLIDKEMYKKNELLREKSLIQTDYKMKESRKKEIEKNENFIQAQSRIEILNHKLAELEKSADYMSASNLNKKRKGYQSELENYRSLLKEYNDIISVKDKILNRLKEIKYFLSNSTITSTRVLGQDIDHNEYLYFEGSNRIFIRIKKGKLFFEYKYYADMQDIEELVNNKLLEKGTREKNLKRRLLKIISKLKSVNYEQENSSTDEIAKKQSQITNLQPAVEILIKIDEKISDYLSAFSKEWEELKVRNKWREIIQSNCTLENLSNSLKMLNLRFKNPYRNDEPAVSDTEDIIMKHVDIPSYKFTTNIDSSQTSQLVVYEYDQRKVLAPKVKIWSKDLETYEMEKYYSKYLLCQTQSASQLFLTLHFYESVIFSLIKRRETIGKKTCNLIREINDLEMVNVAQESEPSQNDHEKTVSLPEVDAERTESIIPSVQSSDKKNVEKQPVKKQTQAVQNVRILKRKRNQNTSQKWSETCYVCGEYGDLLCCDGCPNKNPDRWLCQYCEEKNDLIQKKKARI